ncbi:hypothetical protein CEXT_101461 [Caerostris extrusa]|uniref:Uncharacterized protein n=1 Tax=Caerostris extrusa TaxID=172846 RepID=A0AAV4TFW7_CAEEX|nr:hypothetical protein CEXT_101461 [Caerostris extrusa]
MSLAPELTPAERFGFLSWKVPLLCDWNDRQPVLETADVPVAKCKYWVMSLAPQLTPAERFGFSLGTSLCFGIGVTDNPFWKVNL